MSKVLVFLAEGFEEIEALTPVDLLRRAGVEVETVSITADTVVVGARNISVNADNVIDKADFEGADMIVLPGGMPGTNNLNACDRLMQEVESYITGGKYVAAICAAPAVILGRRGYLAGKKACCYPGMEEDLKEATVEYNSVSVDGNIITSRGVGCAIDFAAALISVFLGEDKASSIEKSVVYNKDL